MLNLTAALEGKKTYAIVALYLFCVALEAGLGWDVPGFVVEDDWLQKSLAALGLGTLRAGVSSMTRR